MSTVRILRKVGKALLDVIEIDVARAYEATLDNTVSEHPVEDGSTISDHVRNEPARYSVTGIVTNFPLRVGLGVAPARDDSRATTAKNQLEVMRLNKELVQIEDHLSVWPDMMLTGLSFPVTPANRNGLQFTASFIQVTLVGVATVQLSDDPDVLAVATPAADRGKVTAEDATPEADANASILVRGFKAVGVLD